MAITKLSNDAASDWYHDGYAPNWYALEDDGRIRSSYDRNDWTPGDVVYSLQDDALILTATGETLWRWDSRY